MAATFELSYRAFEEYPSNLVYKSTYPGALLAYRKRLDEAESALFTKKDAGVSVRFRDYMPNQQAFWKEEINNDATLEEWLGGGWAKPDGGLVQAPNAPTSRQDPKCRFVFVYAAHSRASLKIKRKMLARILSYHQVMPNYLDFVSVFGPSELPREIRFSAFREQVRLNIAQKSYQLCYNLKGPGQYTNPTDPQRRSWTIRQAGIHHQFNVQDGNTLWIIIKGDLDVKSRIEDMTGRDGRREDRSFDSPAQCFASSLAVHLLLCDWSVEQWRWCLKSYEDSFDKETRLAVEAPRNRAEAALLYTFDNLQIVQRLEDQVNEMTMVLEANNDVLQSLRDFYEGLSKNGLFSLKDECAESIETFVTQVDSFIKDSKLSIARAKVLSRIMSARKAIVLQHLNSQSTDEMKLLTVNMNRMTELAQKDARVVLIIAVVTLVYLPATFVSTFFSTDVVKYQGNDGTDLSSDPGDFSLVALCRWLQVALPLTALTLFGSWVSYRWLVPRKKPAAETLPFVAPEKRGYQVDRLP